MANMCDWILKARCRSMEDAENLAEALRNLPGQMSDILRMDIDDCLETDGYVFVETDGECEWNLERSGMLEQLRKLCHNSRLGDIEVFSDYATKFSGNGDVLSDTCQEHLYLGMDNEVMTHSFLGKNPGYGEFRI